MARKSTKPRSSIYDKDYAPYGMADHKGSASEWRHSYEQRMLGHEEAATILGDDNPYSILGLAQGANKDAVKAAYRKIVMAECTAAFGLNPDPKVVERFKAVHAAYSFLMT